MCTACAFSRTCLMQFEAWPGTRDGIGMYCTASGAVAVAIAVAIAVAVATAVAVAAPSGAAVAITVAAPSGSTLAITATGMGRLVIMSDDSC